MPVLKLEKCQTLEQLGKHFEAKLLRIKQTLVLRNGCPEDSEHGLKLLASLSSSLSELQTILTVMRAEISRRKRALENVEVLKQTTGTLYSRMEYVSSHLPERLPQRSPHIPSPEVLSDKRHLKDVTNSQINVESSQTTQKKKSAVPCIQYITTEEFQAVPKYIKGRITYSQVNGAVDELNKAFSGKYKILSAPKQARSENLKKKIVVYRAQDNKDSKGLHYIVDGDIKEFTNLKLDSVGRSLVTIMRHCQRLKEIRGGGLTRYSIVV